VGDTAFFGAEAEFFIFDNVRFDQKHTRVFTLSMPMRGGGIPDASRIIWVTVRVIRKATFGAPTDHYQDLRAQMVTRWSGAGWRSSATIMKVATAGQSEIDQRFNTLVKSADNMMTYKYIVAMRRTGPARR